MEPLLLFEMTLARELGRAEVARTRAVAGVFALGAAVGAVFLLSIGDQPALRAPGRRYLMLLVAAAYVLVELAIAALASRQLALRGAVPAALSWLSAAFDSVFPAIFLAFSVNLLPGADPFYSPLLLGYGLSIPLTALRLDPRLSLFSGALGASSYLALWLLYGQAGATLEASPQTHVFRAALIFLAGLATALVAGRLRQAMEQSIRAVQEQNRVVDIFGRYLTDEVVDVLLHQPGALALGGHKRTVSVLLTDLRGFSVIAESLPPERVVALLNRYFGAMIEVIEEHGGTIDEFIGDAVLVLFNALLPQPDHAARAVRCALAMQRAMAEVNAWNAANGLPAIEMGVGVHTGEVVVGNIGSYKRQKYGVVGSTVNLAARIEGYTVGGQVLVSEAVAAAVGEGLVVRAERSVSPKGAARPIRILDVVGLGNLRLADDAEELHPVPPLPVQARVMQGKDVSAEMTPATVIALSGREALLRVDLPLAPLDNLALSLGGGSAFAKVCEAGEGGVKVRFTSVEPPAEAALVAARRAEAP